MSETPANVSAPAITMRGVAAGTNTNPAVTVATEVDWTVNPGEFWVVAGPQHSGKTDFLMMVGGLTAPTAGEYHFLGEPMPIFEEARLARRLKLGFVFDGGQLLNHLTVAENIALPLRYHLDLAPDEMAARVHALLEFTELQPWANSTPGNVGRSLQQRAGLARALALTPEVLLLDSPLTGLDAPHTHLWLHALDELSRGHPLLTGKPLTLVATADDLRPWRGHAKHFACLADQRLLVLGDWAAAESSREKAVRDLLDAAPAHD